MLSQQATTELVLMERVERINIVMATPQQRIGEIQQNPYAIDMDRNNRNCYVCEVFGHMVRYYRNRGININRRMETEDNNNNLKGNGGLIDPN